MSLREELAVGTLEGPEHLVFGAIQTLAVDPSGGIYVFDRQTPSLRYYDSTGRYVRTLGAKGSGPGEYRDILLGLAVRRDGRIIARDPRNGRLTLYDPDGAPSAHWPLASGLFTSQALTLTRADHAYLKILTAPPVPDRPWPMGLLHLDSDGRVVDTILPPAVPDDPQSSGGAFAPRKIWAFSPRGYFVVGGNNRYAFEIRAPGKPVLRIERTWHPVRLHPEERTEWEALREWAQRSANRSSSEAPTPETKPAYRGFFFGTDGRIWVHRHTEAVERPSRRDPQAAGSPGLTWREPTVFDVFEEDGTYLGEVRVPLGTNLMEFGREQVWGTRLGEHDEPQVVRFRLVPTDSTAASVPSRPIRTPA